jgi:hypothetical protein
VWVDAWYVGAQVCVAAYIRGVDVSLCVWRRKSHVCVAAYIRGVYVSCPRGVEGLA